MADGILNPIEQLEAEIDFEVYTKQEVDALLDEKADKSDTYTKQETDALLDDKADADAVYTKTETDTLLSAKADKSTTLAGYGITDAYTKTQTDNLLNGKADADSVYTKSEIDTKIPNTVGSATKPTYVNSGVLTECTYELNKTVPANAVFTDTTYTAGNGLNLSGTSFSAKAGANVTVDSSGINVNGNGVVASADSGLINGGTAYTELRPTLDGTWVKNAQTTAINLQKLEGGIEYIYAILSKQYDQLKKYINGNYYNYQTDSDSKYVKTVPAGAMPYASLNSIGGKTLVWNQLASLDGLSAQTSNGVTFTPNADGSWTISGTATGRVSTTQVIKRFYIINGHKYIFGLSTTLPNGFRLRFTGATPTYVTETDIVSCTADTNLYAYLDSITDISTTVVNFSVYITVHDLTLMFGAGNEPTTVQEFEAMFPASYYSYNAGTLLSAGITEVVSKGKNLCNIADTSNISSQTVLGSVDLKSGTYTISATLTNNTTINGYLSLRLGSTAKATITTSSGETNVRKSATVTLTDDATYTVVVSGVSAGYSFDVADTQIEAGSPATAYSPYQENTYPIPAEVQALEGYGWSAGSVFNYIDYERKKFVKCVDKIVLDGTQTISLREWRPTDNGIGWRYAYNVTNNAMVGTEEYGNIVADKLPTNTYLNCYNGNVGISVSSSTSFGINIWQSDTTLTTSSAINTYMSANPITVYYELATPIETDISAYLTDDNLIEVEAGGTLTFPNSNGTDYQIPVPSAETYMVDLQSALGE